MAIQVTVLENDETFCTMIDGEVLFWRIVNGSPRQVDITQIPVNADWTLNR